MKNSPKLLLFLFALSVLWIINQNLVLFEEIPFQLNLSKIQIFNNVLGIVLIIFYTYLVVHNKSKIFKF